MVGKTVLFEGELYLIVGQAIASKPNSKLKEGIHMLRLNKVEGAIFAPNFVSLYVPCDACDFPPSNISSVFSEWSIGVSNA